MIMDNCSSIEIMDSLLLWLLIPLLTILFVSLMWLMADPQPLPSLPCHHGSTVELLRQAEQIPPLLLLPETEEKLPKMYSLSGHQFFSLPLPELNGGRDKTLLSSKGWIFIIDNTNLEMSLVHPLSCLRFPLPAVFKDTKKAVLSLTPSESKKFTVAVIHGESGQVALWRPGELGWTGIIDCDNCCDLIYYHGQFYGVYMNGAVFACDLSGKAEVVATPPTKIRQGRRLPAVIRSNLVESSGKLFVVYRAEEYSVFALDVKGRKWRNVMRALEDRALFFGGNSSFSLQLTDQTRSSFKPSCIYFADSVGVSVFDMRERYGHKEDLLPPQARNINRLNPPLWMQHFGLIS